MPFRRKRAMLARRYNKCRCGQKQQPACHKGRLVDADLERESCHVNSNREVHVCVVCDRCGETLLFSQTFNNTFRDAAIELRTGLPPDMMSRAVETLGAILTMTRSGPFDSDPEVDYQALEVELLEIRNGASLLQLAQLDYAERIVCESDVYDFATASLVTASKEIVDLAHWVFRQDILTEEVVDKLFPVVDVKDAVAVLRQINQTSKHRVNLWVESGARKKQVSALVGGHGKTINA